MCRMLSTLARLLAGGLLPLLTCGGCGSAPADESIVLRVANWSSPAVESGFMAQERTFREEFEARHPGVRVLIEQIPGELQYAPKLLMMHVSGSMPDVVHLDASSAAVFIDNGVLADCMLFIRRDPDFDLEDFFPNAVDFARRGDALYAIPLDFTPMMMYYNKRLFDVAGVPYPRPGWSWNDFLETCQRLTVWPEGATRPAQYGFRFDNWMPAWVLWLWTNDGDVLSSDGKRASGYLDGPGTTEAVQFLVDLITRHRVAPNLDESAAAGVDLFRAGRAALDLRGHWMLIDFRADKLDVGVVPLPTNTGAAVTVLYEAGLAIARRTCHPELAWEYVKFMTSAEVQVRRVASGLAISGNRRAAEHFAGNPAEDAFLDAVRYARPPWGARVERYPYVEELGREMMEDILHGNLSVPEALRRTARLVDALLAEQ